jgi:peptidylprolyl isomerase
MKKVENGRYVKVSYTGKFDNGEVFDAADACHPLEFQVGSGDVIKGFEDALLGMAPNEKKTFTVPPEDAYGHRDDSLEHTFDRSDLPSDFSPAIGEVIVLQTEEGDQTLATVKQIESQTVLVDLNHPLAGKSLTFDVEVNEINDEPSPTSCPSGCSCS